MASLCACKSPEKDLNNWIQKNKEADTQEFTMFSFVKLFIIQPISSQKISIGWRMFTWIEWMWFEVELYRHMLLSLSWVCSTECEKLQVPSKWYRTSLNESYIWSFSYSAGIQYCVMWYSLTLIYSEWCYLSISRIMTRLWPCVLLWVVLERYFCLSLSIHVWNKL